MRTGNQVIVVFVLLVSCFASGLAWCASSSADLDQLSGHHDQARNAEPSEQRTMVQGDPGRRALVQPETADGFYGALTGSRLSWRFTHQSTYRLELLAQEGDLVLSAGNDPVSIPFRGNLHMQILERSDQITVLVQGSEVEARVPGPVNQRGAASLRSCKEALEEWFLVRIDPQGTVLGYAFQPGRTAEQRNFARAVIAAFFHTIPDELPRTWEAREADPTGEYTASYRFLSRGDSHSNRGPQIERRKCQYLSIGQEAEVPQHSLSGCSRAVFDSHVSWIASVQADEAFSLAVPGLAGRAHLAVQARFEAIQTAWRGVVLDPTQWPTFVSASGNGEDLSAGARANERDGWRQKTELVSLDDLLVKIRALVEARETRSREFYETWELLSWKLALDREAVAAAQDLVLRGALPESTADMLLTALGKAGTDEAQGALLAVLNAPGLVERQRESAAIAMFQLAKPTLKVVQNVADRLRGQRAFAQLHATNLLLLGALAPRSETNLADGRSGLAALLAFEQRSRDLGVTGVWLDALGNAAVPEVAAYAARYLGDKDPLVREAAVAAIDRSRADGVVPALVRVAEQDRGRDVRLRAIEALGRRDVEAGRKALRALSRDADQGIRGAAIHALAARPRLATGDRTALEHTARNDPSQELRAAARRLLSR